MLLNRIEKPARVVAALAVATCLATSAFALLASSSSVGAADGRQTPDPTIDPASVDTEAADFTLKTGAEGAFCDGSGGEGWRVQTFIVDADRDLSSMTFTGSFPVGVVGTDLDASDGSIEAALHNGSEPVRDISPAGSPAGLISPNAFSGIDFSYDAWNLVDGDYQIGFACVLNNVLKQWWATTVAIDTAGSPFLEISEAAAEAVATAVTVTAAPTSAKVGEDVTFTATVTPAAAAGNLELLVDGVSEGTKAASAGTATWTVSDLKEGTRSVTASFTPTDAAAYKTSTSAPLSVSVAAPTAATTSVVLTADPPTEASEGDSVTLTAALTPATAAGKVTFKDGTASLGAAVGVTDGTATISTTALPLGTRSLTADFVPTDPKLFTTSTGTLSYVVGASGAEDVTVTIAADPADRAPLGQDVEFTASIDPKVEGEVEFFRAEPDTGSDDDTDTTTTTATTSTTAVPSIFGAAESELVDDGEPEEVELVALADPIAVADGQAVLRMKDLAPGDLEIYAVFTPEDTDAYKVSTSEALLFTVEGSATSTTVPTGSVDTTPTTAPVINVAGSGTSSGGSLPITGVSLLFAGAGFALLYVGRTLYLLSRPVEHSTPS